MNRKILILIFAVAFVITFVFFSDSMNANVFQAHDGIVVKNNEIVDSGITVVAAGELQRKLLAGNTIYGTLRIDKQPPLNFVLTNNKGVYQGAIYEGQGNSNLVEVGKLSASSGLKSLQVELTGIEDQHGKGSILYAPATTLDEAQKLANKFK